MHHSFRQCTQTADTGQGTIFLATIASARQAVAALEFAILAPIMALLVVGVFDLSKVAILWEQIWNASRGIAESASTMSIPSQISGPSMISWNQANLALSTVLADVPWLRAGIATGSAVTGSPPVYAVLSSVNYAPAQGCTSNCSYTSLVEWSKAYPYTGFNYTAAVLRPCGAALAQNGLGQDSSTPALSTLTLQTDNISVPDPFLVADVTLVYTPFFFSFITGPITLSATSYIPARINTPGSQTQWVEFDDTNDPVPASACSYNGAATE